MEILYESRRTVVPNQTSNLIINSQTSIKRSPLGQRKSDLTKQVTF